MYAEVLKNRLEKEAEEKRMIPETQAGFRRGRSTIDNIFMIIHVQREGSKKGEDGKIFMMFADLKAAFDKVDRDKLWNCLKERGIRENLKELRRLTREQR